MRKIRQNADITGMGIVPLLAAVLSGSIPTCSGSTDKPNASEKKRGTIKSLAARRLYSAASILSTHLREIAEAHDRQHDAAQEPAPHDCAAFQKKATRLLARHSIVNELMWQAIYEEHPRAIVADVGIREGWGLFSEDGDWEDARPVFEATSIASTLVPLIASIVNGKPIPANEEGFNLATTSELSLGSLDDLQVRSFRAIVDQIRAEGEKLVPADIRKRDLKALGRMTLDDVRRIGGAIGHLNKLSELVMTLFWCGVRDTIPAASMEPQIGIRSGWNVVKLAPKPEQDKDGSEMVMTPWGPALSLELPLSGGLSGLLRKLGR